MIFQQGAGRQLHVVVVPSALGRAVAREVLEARGNLSLLLWVYPLIPPHHGGGHLSVQIRVFAGGFHHPAPPGVPHQVGHGGEGHVNPRRRGFPGGDGGPLLDRLRVKGAALGQGNGKHGAVAVDDVRHEQKRNMVRVLGHEFRLQLPDLFRADDGKIAARQTQVLLGQPHIPRRPGRRPFMLKISRQLYQLTDFFLQAHLAEQLPQFRFFH